MKKMETDSTHALRTRASGVIPQRAQLQYTIVNHYLNDTTGTDSLKIYLAAQPDLWAKQLLLMQYLAEADTAAVDALLQTIPINSLNSSQQAEWNDLVEYYSLYKQIAANENNLPDSLQLIALTDLATHMSAAGSYARNLLINHGALVYNEPYIFPDDNLKSGKVIRKKQIIGANDFVLKVYPNPASSYTIVEYDFAQITPSPSVTINDEMGRLIKTISLSGISGFQVIPLTNLATGMYVLRLTANKVCLKESKLVVVR